MKSFFFTTEYKTAKYGFKVTNKVYRIVNNRVKLIGEAHYQTGSFRGHDHEAMQVLVDNKQLPANCQKNGYIDYDKRDKVYVLRQLDRY